MKSAAKFLCVKNYESRGKVEATSFVYLTVRYSWIAGDVHIYLK